MKLSAFTPLGHLKMKAGRPVGRQIYDAMIADLGEQFDVSEGTHVEASTFAEAKSLARVSLTMDRAWEQLLPRKANDMLATREREYKLTPRYGEGVADRRRTLASRKLLPLGAARLNVEQALTELLGDDFIAYRTTRTDEVVRYPDAIGDQPMNLAATTVERKLLQTSELIIGDNGNTQTVSYTLVDQPVIVDRFGLRDARQLVVGDVLTIDPGGQVERVEVEAVGTLTFTATFTKPHPAGCLATTQPFPYWISTQRHSLIVLTPTAASDPEKRRKVHELMSRIARGISTWDITAGDATTTNGPFRVGVGILGVTTIGAVPLP